MRFAFNPESDFERDLIDRCIDGHYGVDITMADGHKHEGVTILERRERLTELVIRSIDATEPSYLAETEISVDAIDTVMVW